MKYAVMLAGVVLLAGRVVAQQCTKDCPGDANGDGRVQVNELLLSVDNALHGCAPPTQTVNLSGSWGGIVIVSGGSANPFGFSFVLDFSLTQSGTSALGTYVTHPSPTNTAVASSGSITANQVLSCEGSTGGYFITFVATEASPCSGTFAGTLTVDSASDRMAGLYVGSDCHGTIEANFLGGRI